MMFVLSLSFLIISVHAWLPSLEDSNVPSLFRRSFSRIYPRNFSSASKIRGVNLGSLFIIEPWMASTEWSNMGCSDQNSEWDCVKHLGQTAANVAFQNHWNTWITESDIANMSSYGLNTVRIPVGYWLREDLVTAGEYFPQGGMAYLKQVCTWATSKGIFIVIDLHGLPGAQQPNQAFTGQYSSTANFYNNDTNFERTYKFLEWITTEIHSNITSFGNVGMLEILNEPLQGQSNNTDTMISAFYPTAVKRIRAAESALGVTSARQLHIQVMDSLWGAGDPLTSLGSTENIAFDDHEYIKWNPSLDKTSPTKESYLSFACNDDRGTDGNSPKIIGEWSLSIDDAHEHTTEFAATADNAAYYSKLFSAQQQSFEEQEGWIYWSWKAQLGDYRWSYVDAVAAGAIPSDLDASAKADVC